MAMACLRLFTRPPLPFPLRSVPCFRLRIALATSRLELRLYLRRLVRRAMSIPPGLVRVTSRRRICNRRAARKGSGVPADNHHDRHARLSDASRGDPVRRVWLRASLHGRSPLRVPVRSRTRASPSGAPGDPRSRRARSNSARSFRTRVARWPPQWAGESRKMRLTGAGGLPGRASVSSIVIPAARPARWASEAPARRRRRACPCGDRGRTDGASVHLPSTR